MADRINELLFSVVAGAVFYRLLGSISSPWPGIGKFPYEIIHQKFAGPPFGTLIPLIVVGVSVLSLVFCWRKWGSELRDRFWDLVFTIIIASVAWPYERVLGVSFKLLENKPFWNALFFPLIYVIAFFLVWKIRRNRYGS